MTHADALAAYVHEHAGLALPALRGVEPADADALEDLLTVEAVHGTRTSLRRLRAALRIFAESFRAPPETDGDLRFVARALSDVRDTDVLGEHLLEEIDALPASLVIGPVREELREALADRRRTALANVGRRSEDPRWGRALTQVADWQREPPRLLEQRPLALLESAREEVRRLLQDAHGDLPALHAARKAAKRWRYAAELLEPVEPGATAHYEAATEVHVRLGELQDAVVAREFLLEHARTGEPVSRSGFTLGVLHERAGARIESLVVRAPQLL
jgi:CHAD domain-containing protein